MPDPHASHFERRAACPGCSWTAAHTLYRASLSEGPLFDFLQRYYRSVTLPREKLATGEYVLDECAACSLVFQRFIPSPAFLEEIYDRWLNSSYHPTQDPDVAQALAAPAQSRDGHELLAAARALGKPVEQLRVLDYGMGWGLWAQVAKALGCTVFGFDLSESRRQWATQHGIQVVSLTELPGLELDFANTEQVFEHLSTPLEDATALAASLRRGGIFKVAVPQAPNLRQRLAPADWDTPRSTDRSLNPVHPLEHLNCWNPVALGALAHRVGLEPQRVPLRSYYAFATRLNAVPLGSARALAKALLRPAYHRLSQHNLYAWFRKPA